MDRASILMPLLVAAVIATACRDVSIPRVQGDAENGRLLLRQFGCGTCHRIPGVAGAQGNVGPPLEGIAQRIYLAGILPNQPDNMIRWIREPHSVNPRTLMPDLQVTEPHARDMAAYLYQLR
ncbi:MAG TPA: cytochrome C1 [Casimicrobiaceae bacterium]|nr:cytochrome C1 [Casimicrobiaceae bacterium]